MQLVSVDGANIDLRPMGYQYPGITAAGKNDWDANWLIVAGDVRLADGRSWSFSDPCLTTWEARELGDWLRAVAAGRIEPTRLDGEERLEVFTEPCVALSVARRSAVSAAVRWHFSLEGRPDWVGRHVAMFDFFVTLELPLLDLSAAVDTWDRELSAFPPR